MMLMLSGEVYQVNLGLLKKTGAGTLVLAGTQDNAGLGAPLILHAGARQDQQRQCSRHRRPRFHASLRRRSTRLALAVKIL